MALDLVVMDGDKVEFSITNGVTLTPLKPTTNMKASGKTTINGKRVCAKGDEEAIVLTCMYTTSEHTQAGVGNLRIKELAPDQLARKVSSGNESIILKGTSFDSQFDVQVPAQDIKPVASGGAPIPDTTLFYEGKGRITTTNNKIKAT